MQESSRPITNQEEREDFLVKDAVRRQLNEENAFVIFMSNLLVRPSDTAAGAQDISWRTNPVTSLSALSPTMRETAIKVYKAAFAREPYCEHFTDDEVISAFNYILEKGGDLLFGTSQENTIAFIGGYMKGGTYYIDELAVDPDQQGKGYGKKIFSELQGILAARGVGKQEIRTTSQNEKAIRLYESAGFVRQFGLEIVFRRRNDQKFGFDERVYLARPALTEKERLMKLKRLAVTCPSGNPTAIVFDQLTSLDRNELNSGIMSSWKKRDPDSPHQIEQCCFVTKPRDQRATARVEMFGGEFCGNATRSVIWLVTKGKNYEGLIEVSGVSRPLNFSVTDGTVKLEMPLPATEEIVKEVDEGSLVALDGISHLIVTDHNNAPFGPRKLMESLLAEDKYGCTSLPAFGVTCFDPISETARFCVWVKTVDTIFDETACGSGTCSIGISMATQRGSSIEQDVMQPSGQMIRTITEIRDGKIVKSSIAGKVDILYDGEFSLE